jgi:NADPH:quinone reductase-like Zn-dependent oxidoreductase
MDGGSAAAIARSARSCCRRSWARKLGTFVPRENHEDMIVLKELIEAGKITPVIDRTYPLSDAPQAVRYVEQGHARGKVVISLRANDERDAREVDGNRVVRQ